MKTSYVHVNFSRFLKEGIAAIVTVIMVSYLLAGATVNAEEMEVTVQGEIFNSVDAADILGYGGTGGADGTRVTIQYLYDTDRVPPDWYGGARFPREADYFSYGNSSTAPSWVSSRITFDNGVSFSSDDYEGTVGTTDQVKIIERDGGAPYDYMGFYDRAYDASGGFQLSAVVYDLYQNFVNGLSPGQSVTWASTGVQTPPISAGYYNFRDVTAGWIFTGQIIIDSLEVKPRAIKLSIDIKPGKTPNSINPTSGQKIPVAILTTDTFLAFNEVDPLSVEFGPDGATEFHRTSHVKDLDDDGDMDVLFHFDTSETGIACGDTKATLIGQTYDGQQITGSDSIKTVKCPPVTIETITVLIGDKDCFGLGGICSDGDPIPGGFDNRDLGDPLGTDQWGTSVPLGGPSFDFELDLNGATPLSASLTTFTAGIELVGATFYFNGAYIGFYTEPDGQENIAATVVFDVPNNLLSDTNNISLTIPDLGLVQDGFVIDYLELTIETAAASP